MDSIYIYSDGTMHIRPSLLLLVLKKNGSIIQMPTKRTTRPPPPLPVHHERTGCDNLIPLCVKLCGFVGGLSSLGLLTVAARALFHGDWLKYGGLALWVVIHAGVMSLIFLPVLFAWVSQHLSFFGWCKGASDHMSATEKNAFNHVAMRFFLLTLLSILVALVIGMSWASVDKDSIAAFNQNFPENFYKFTGTDVNSMLAAYTKWQSVWNLTFFFAAFHLFLSLDLWNRS